MIIPFGKVYLSPSQEIYATPTFIFTAEKIFSFQLSHKLCHALAAHKPYGGVSMLKRHMIERDIPGIGEFSLTELCAASRASNKALADIGPGIQWQHSYIAGDKTFCIYLAQSEEEIRRHSELSGIPVGKFTEVPQIIDPLTANN